MRVIRLTDEDAEKVKNALDEALTWEKETEIGFEEDMPEHLAKIKELERLKKIFY